MEVLMPSLLNSAQISVRKDLWSNVFHPALEVRASGASGTSVTCAGRTSSTSEMKLGMGLPSMFSSVFIKGFIALTSAYLICLSSGLGCTVMPSAPKASQSRAAFSTSGLFPPRALRRVANLLILTLNLVIMLSPFKLQKYALLSETCQKFLILCDCVDGARQVSGYMDAI